MKISALLQELSVDLRKYSGSGFSVYTPLDGSKLATLRMDKVADVDEKVKNANLAFKAWREIPAPRRGELVRLYGEELRAHKEALGKLVTLECGKIIGEGLGEVQEMIDICDFAVGLSRQLHGLTIASERAQHAMQESWHPLGVVAVISAFNFPVAVWAWNFILAIACGDAIIWKPSEKTPLCALACQALFAKALARFAKEGGVAPRHLSQVILGDAKIGERLINNPGVALVSATGSSRMGRIVGPKVAARFGKSLLELGGNNAVIVSEKADINLALSAILFGTVATSGQRCTTTRRVIVHRAVATRLFEHLKKSFGHIAKGKIGYPLDTKALMGPLIDEGAFTHMRTALRQAKAQGGQVFFGQRVLKDKYPDAFYIEPALVKMPRQTEIVRHETFAPILYVMPYKTLDEALRIHNDVPQGLSSSIFTTDLREAEYFRQHSDCGIVNINVSTNGAEIGGAFGGEKETGGGRESGSDCWKNYMRRQTSTLYFGRGRPALAQGISFDAG
jgi:aldehyde dehydrogenase (NAD+)